MAYRRKTTRRAASSSRARRSTSYSRSAPSRVRRSTKRAAPRRRAAVAPRAQKVVVELVYRDASDVARPQGVVETRKGSKPKM